MENVKKFVLPPPCFQKKSSQLLQKNLHFLTPNGMTLLPRERQPPPMYGPRGATLPGKFLNTNQINITTEEKQYCEPCDMELQSLQDLKVHRSQHEPCPVEGCKYRLHESVMDKHVETLHMSGIFEKIKKLSTPEEIAEWREERRKRYPTVANTQQQQLAREHRQKRGERLEGNKSRFGKSEDRKRTQQGTNEKNLNQNKDMHNGNNNNNRGKNNKKRNRIRGKKKPRNSNKAHIIETNITKSERKDDEEAELICGGVNMFRGTSKMKNYHHVKEKKICSNVLTGLLGMYGSDSDNEDSNESESSNESVVKQEDNTFSNESNEKKDAETTNSVIESAVDKSQGDILEIDSTKNNAIDLHKICEANTESHIQKVKEEFTKHLSSVTDPKTSNDVSLQQQTPKSVADSSDEEPLEEAIAHSSDYTGPVKNTTAVKTQNSNRNIDDQPANKRPKTMHTKTPRSGLDYRKAFLRKQNTMLEKLLETDIRHERNVLLQCVRFVCNNDFFGIGAKPTNS